MIKKNKKSKSLYQIKVTLLESKPPIWRRLIVKDNIRLDQLHSVLQVAMGWSNYHFLDAIQDPKHEEHESMLEWVGGEFDPDEFDINFINKELNDMKL